MKPQTPQFKNTKAPITYQDHNVPINIDSYED